MRYSVLGITGQGKYLDFYVRNVFSYMGSNETVYAHKQPLKFGGEAELLAEFDGLKLYNRPFNDTWEVLVPERHPIFNLYILYYTIFYIKGITPLREKYDVEPDIIKRYIRPLVSPKNKVKKSSKTKRKK